jgi:hypothetical protein
MNVGLAIEKISSVRKACGTIFSPLGCAKRSLKGANVSQSFISLLP